MNKDYLYIVSGIVSYGKKRGKDLGFPTANIKTDNSIPHGIYISETEVSNTLYPSLTFIGDAKTFGEKEIVTETYIIGFDKNIYDISITVYFISKIRDNQKFDTIDALVTQMREDEKKAKEYFKKRNR